MVLNFHVLTKGACRNGPGPCTVATCRYSLLADTTSPGEWKGRAPKKVAENCALDAAENGAMTLDEIALEIGRTRERVRQIEARAMAKIRRIAPELAEVLRDALARQGENVWPAPFGKERRARRRSRIDPTRW